MQESHASWISFRRTLSDKAGGVLERFHDDGSTSVLH